MPPGWTNPGGEVGPGFPGNISMKKRMLGADDDGDDVDDDGDDVDDEGEDLFHGGQAVVLARGDSG